MNTIPSQVKEGYTRLYRAAEEHPKDIIEFYRECREKFETNTLDQAHNYVKYLLEENFDKGVGRWFTNSLEEAMWYNYEDFEDTGELRGRIFYIDLPNDEAERFKVRNLPKDSKEIYPQKMSFKHDVEYFLPQDLAKQVQEYPLEMWKPVWEEYAQNRQAAEEKERQVRLNRYNKIEQNTLSII